MPTTLDDLIRFSAMPVVHDYSRITNGLASAMTAMSALGETSRLTGVLGAAHSLVQPMRIVTPQALRLALDPLSAWRHILPATPVVPSTWSSFFATLSWLDGFDDISRRAAMRLARFNEILAHLGWPPALQLVSRQVTSIIDLVGDDDPELHRAAVEQIIVAGYDDEVLGEMVRAWESKEWIGHRMPILRRVVRAGTCQ